MASQGKKRLSLSNTTTNKDDAGIITRVTRTVSESSIMNYTKQAVSDAGFVTKKLLKSTGKAAWIAGTTFLILVVPLIIEMDREQQLNDIELQQQSLLGAPPLPGAPQK